MIPESTGVELVLSKPNETEVTRRPKRIDAKKSYAERRSVDEHNEVCEVCETGGDLLCCDTCSLVFHLACIRPKLASVPKGEWSCAYCVLDVCNSRRRLILSIRAPCLTPFCRFLRILLKVTSLLQRKLRTV
jgi:hypothetical protein